MKKLAILDFETGRLTKYTKVDLVPKGAALVILRKAMRSDGIETFNKDTRKQYAQSWVDDINEIDDNMVSLEEAIEICADRLVFGGSIHIIDGKTEVDYGFKQETYDEIIRVLTVSVEEAD